MGGAKIATGLLPKHQRLREVLIGMVVPGEAIPSERELMATYDVSRATVRKAIDGLVADGLLQRTHGVGTFAVRPRLETRLHLASFSQDMRRRGRVPSTRLISVALGLPPTEVAEALAMEPGAQAWRVVRIRLADGEPVAHEDGWYPADLLPGLDRQDIAGGSLYEIFGQQYGGNGPRTFDGVTVVGWERVGNYAIRFDFSDGHRTGIYSYDYLRELAERHR